MQFPSEFDLEVSEVKVLKDQIAAQLFKRLH